MLRVFLAALVGLTSVATAYAGEYRVPGMRTNDRYFTEFGLKRKIIGRTVTYMNGQRFYYDSKGGFTYQLSEEAPKQTGTYKIDDKGKVCAYFAKGKVRCDTYVQSTKYVYFLTGGGQRWQVKSMVRE